MSPPDIDIHFCDPHSPWPHATCENTNGLLRPYFPTATDLSVHRAFDLDWSLPSSTTAPHERLGYAKPIDEIGPLRLRRPPESPNAQGTYRGDVPRCGSLSRDSS